MLINLKLWRQQNLSDRCFDFLKGSLDDLKYWDQDALNKIIDGQFVMLEKKWNSLIDLSEGKDSELSNSIIVHYVGSLKPWQIWCVHPGKAIYWDYLKQSPWKNASPEFPKDFKKFLSAIYSVKKQIVG